MIGLWAAAIPLTFYLVCPSTYWNFDGVACAAALELGNPVYFFHAQHLMYGFLGFLFWKLLLPLGVVKALPALQIFCSLLSAAGFIFSGVCATRSKDAVAGVGSLLRRGLQRRGLGVERGSPGLCVGIFRFGRGHRCFLLAAERANTHASTSGLWHGVAVSRACGAWALGDSRACTGSIRKKLPWRPYHSEA